MEATNKIIEEEQRVVDSEAIIDIGLEQETEVEL